MVISVYTSHNKHCLITTHLLLLTQMEKLRCFMYVSTAYSNAHLKKYSTVHEQLYPLREQDGREVDHAAVVDRLLAMPVEDAQQEVKHLTAGPICCRVDTPICLLIQRAQGCLQGCLYVCLPDCQPACSFSNLQIGEFVCLPITGAVFVLVSRLPTLWFVAVLPCNSVHANLHLLSCFSNHM